MTNEKMICNMTKEECANELEMLRDLRDIVLNEETYWEFFEKWNYGFDPDKNGARFIVESWLRYKYGSR